ncbi:MAG TPA: peptigoglycan-binding protein LysM, partial [Pseudomonas sp.]|nr:peptigoglycan-binding protein LysM [Pseudomonas sp.]
EDSSRSDEVSLEDELDDFSLDLNDQPAAAIGEDELMSSLEDEPSKPATVEPADDLDFELSEPEQSADMPDEFDLSLEDEPAVGAAPETFNSELDEIGAELEDLSRDLGEPLDQAQMAPTAAIEPVEPASEALDDEFDFFSDTDETTTKLDLARAYIDMGDAEGARDILDEVMSEGSDSQQQEAREMLAKLA